MGSLATRLRRNPRLYLLLRSMRMRIRRWRYGLKHVHPTFYAAAGCCISPDLVAHEYSFINMGCMVEIGRAHV